MDGNGCTLKYGPKERFEHDAECSAVKCDGSHSYEEVTKIELKIYVERKF